VLRVTGEPTIINIVIAYLILSLKIYLQML
jgi:hypothetical protein